MDRGIKRWTAGGLLVIACTAVFAVAAGSAAAGERLAYGGPVTSHERGSYIAVGDATRPPIGWVEFCIRYKPECDDQAVDGARRGAHAQGLVRHGQGQRLGQRPISSRSPTSSIGAWSSSGIIPSDGHGDCEDYVLLKRRMLMRAGWPREALLITVVRDKKGDGHAVLTVKTNRGEFILDNQESEILSWDKTGYRFVKRQAQSDPNEWVGLGEPQAPATVSAR